jgi:hypothetical protein
MSSEPSVIDPIVWDEVALIEVPVTIGNTKYVLREADVDVACKYKNALMGAVFARESGTGTTNIADVEPLLVSLCISYGNNGAKDDHTPVPLATVRSWKPALVEKLADRVKKISKLNKEDNATPDQIAQVEKMLADMKAKAAAQGNS